MLPSPGSRTVTPKWASTPPRVFNAHVYIVLKQQKWQIANKKIHLKLENRNDVRVCRLIDIICTNPFKSLFRIGSFNQYFTETAQIECGRRCTAIQSLGSNLKTIHQHSTYNQCNAQF